MKIAVTGATGHIGANVVRGLLDNGFEVKALYRSASKLRALEGLDVEKAEGNILDEEYLSRSFKKVDAVVHLAAIISIDGDPDGMVMKTNAEGPKKIVNACIKNEVPRLIHFSSIHAYHIPPTLPKADESCTLALEDKYAYNRSKAHGQRAVFEGVKNGLNVTALNPTAVIGPHDYFGSLSGQMLQQLYQGKLPSLVKGGYDWVDVRDLVDATVAVLKDKVYGEPFLLSGNWATIKEIGQLVHQNGGKKPPAIELPLWVAYVGLPFLKTFSKITNRPPLYTGESLENLKRKDVCSSEKATEKLGYTPRPLNETIRDTIEWFKKEGFL